MTRALLFLLLAGCVRHLDATENDKQTAQLHDDFKLKVTSSVGPIDDAWRKKVRKYRADGGLKSETEVFHGRHQAPSSEEKETTDVANLALTAERAQEVVKDSKPAWSCALTSIALIGGVLLAAYLLLRRRLR